MLEVSKPLVKGLRQKLRKSGYSLSLSSIAYTCRFPFSGVGALSLCSVCCVNKQDANKKQHAVY